MTWYFQVKTLAAKYSVYVPDLFLSGGSSTTQSSECSPGFHAVCLLREHCLEWRSALWSDSAKGISRIQGGRLEARPGAFPCRLWRSCGHDGFCIVLSARFSFKTVLMTVVIMQVMSNNRKEREELLEGMLVTGDADTGKQPAFTFTQV